MRNIFSWKSALDKCMAMAFWNVKGRFIQSYHNIVLFKKEYGVKIQSTSQNSCSEDTKSCRNDAKNLKQQVKNFYGFYGVLFHSFIRRLQKHSRPHSTAQFGFLLFSLVFFNEAI